MFILYKIHYLYILFIFFQISLIKSGQPNDIKGDISYLINVCNSKKDKDILNDLSENGGIFRYDDGYRIQISFIESQNYSNPNGIKYPQVKFSEDCKKTILEKFVNSTDIVVTKLFKSYSLDENSNNYIAGITQLTDVLYYQFFPFINNLIDKNQPIDIASLCNEDVIIYAPLYLDEFLKNKFVAVAGQNPESKIKHLRNYDIFDPNAKIYHDICYPLTFSYAAENIITKDSFKNYDISLQQRRKYYFPGNLDLCPSECSYLGTDKDTVSTMCQCKFNKTYSLTGNDITYHDSYTNFKYNEKKFNTTKKDNYLTIEVFKCIKLPFTKSGFKGNYGSIFMLAIICIVILSYIILIISGKYHLLSVLELLYNSNIKSMNYIKNPGSGYTPSPIQYDARSNNNLLLNSQRGVATNGLMMSNILTGNNFISGSNYTYNKTNPIQVGKRTNNRKNSGVQIVSKNTLNKNNAKNDKNNLIVDEIQENDYESERNSIGENKTGINSMNKNKTDLSNKKEEPKKKEPTIKDEPKKEELKKEESEEEPEEEEISSIDKSKRQNSSRINNNENQNKSQIKNNTQNNNNKSKQENKDEEEEESEEDDEDNDSKANPPRKKNGTNKQAKVNGNENGKENGNNKEETKKKKKEKQPIEIALNVKDLREMMFNTMLNRQKSNENGKSKSPSPQQNPPQQNNNNPLQNNGFINPYMNPLGFFPPPYPGYNFGNNNNNNNNEDAIRKEYENKARQRELEFQRERELSEMREKERRREMDDLRERERQRQRDLDYERERRQREDLYRDRNYDKDRSDNDALEREKERLNKQNQEIQKMREKLQKEYDEKQYKDRERDLEMEKELSKQRDLQKQKELEYEKELLKQKDLLKEQFEKEKKEIIERKDKEIQNLREEKDKEIQRLKEDKEREIRNLKEDMDREKRSQDERIKKKEKEFKKEKQKIKELQKLTSNSFFMNGINANSTMQQQIIDINNDFNRFEKIETPQIVVPMDSIFTDQELNAMDYSNSYQYDKRTLCQVYMSFINRKQPLFFLFNYNSSSSGTISTFQINYQSVKFIIFCVELMIYLFFYATFFGSKSITFILQGQFNSRRRCAFAIILSPFCMIAKSVIHHFVYDNINMRIAEIKMRCYNNFLVGRKPEEIKVNEFKDFWESDGDNQKNNNVKEEKKEEIEDIQEIEDDNLPEEEKIRRKDKYEKRKLKSLIKELIGIFRKRIFISFGIMILVMFFMWYYISAFCAVYKNSQLTFFINILISFGFSNLIPFVYCILPTVFKLEAIKEESKFIFLLAQIFQIL